MAIMRSEPFCKRRCGSNERTRSWRARPEPERLTREVLSARHAPVQHHPERQDHQHHPFDRPPTQNGPAFALVSFCVEPPAGIEPATPSLPWNHQEPLCGPAFSQVTLDRKGQSYGFCFDAVM